MKRNSYRSGIDIGLSSPPTKEIFWDCTCTMTKIVRVRARSFQEARQKASLQAQELTGLACDPLNVECKPRE